MGSSPASSPIFWDDPASVDKFLSEQLTKGRLALIIGAGVSFGFGLPSWPSLVEKMHTKKLAHLPIGDLTDISDLFQSKYFKNNPKDFACFVRECLYSDAKINEDALLSSSLLQALAALLSKSARGHATCVLSFNFDDLLENYLDILGVVSKPIDSMPNWNSNADIHIFHPHGLLPFDEKQKVSSSGIVFTASDFENVVGDSANTWNMKMLDIFTSHTCLFLGLSGNDDRLMSLLNTAKSIHPAIKDSNHLNWAVRVTCSTEDEVIRHKWGKNKVAIRTLGDYKDIPNWILTICRDAKKYI